jgi:glycosyltransferase involved in cell wall biosynthesis
MKVWLPAIRAGSGADVFTQRLAAGLQERGVEAVITWLPHMLEFAPFLSSARPPPGCDVIHANAPHAMLARGHGLPLVITFLHCVHEAQFLPYKSVAQRIYHSTLVRPYELAGIRAASAMTAISAYTARSVEREFRPAREVRAILNWIDTDTFRPAPGKQDPHRPFRLLFVGNWSRRKGVDLLPEVMRRLGPDFELRMLCGLRGATLAKLPANMAVLPPAPDEADMVRHYQECDAVLFPSRLEGFGYVPVEAASCGKPVVALRNSSIPEVVADGESGLLCEMDDVEGLVAACRRLAGEPGLHARLCANARDFVLRTFDEDAAIASYIDVYRSVLER